MGNNVVNTFFEGMNKDIDKQVMSSKSYLDAVNFRIITTEGGTSGSLENIKGNKLIEGVGGFITTGQFIIGACEIRDRVVIFTTNNTSTTPSGGRSQIYVVDINTETEEQTGLTLLYDDNLNNSTGYLNFSTAYPIKAISRYETSDIQKVYWTDGYNPVRFIDISKNQTITGEPYTSNDYFDPTRFEFLPSFNPVKPVLSDIISGHIDTGIVQYVYQLYILNGCETAYSPVSDIIHVTSYNDSLSTDINYYGDKEKTNSGKGFKIKIDNTNNLGYNRLRLVRIHYSTISDIPIISVSNEIEISPLGSIVYVSDIGDTLGEITLDEFNINSIELFSCGDIATKSNRLFVSDVTYNYFDVDFDFRAVRFRSSDSTAKVCDSDGDVTIQSNFSNWSDYLEDHDGINEFNDPDNDDDSLKEYKYQSDGSTLGAEGPNIKIGFTYDDFIIDYYGAKYTSIINTYATSSPEDTYNKSFSGYSSPYNTGRKSFQRDEVYRFYAVCRDSRGRLSKPKWIADIRMPGYKDTTYMNLCYDTGVLDQKTAGRKLYPTVQLKNFPSGVESVQIYRTLRSSRADRFVVTQTILNPIQQIGTTGKYMPDIMKNAISTAPKIIKLISPEILVNRNISRQSTDYLEYITDHDSNFLNSGSGTDPRYLVKAFENIDRSSATHKKVNVLDSAFVGPSKDYTIVNSISYRNYDDAVPSKGIGSYGCSGLLVAYDDSAWSVDGKKIVIANYKSNVFGSQYGGHTYEERALNTIIPCSDIITDTSSTTIYGGDTFINYIDVTSLIWDLTATSLFNDTLHESFYIPLESSINWDLISSTSSPHKVWFGTIQYRFVLTQEYAGEHELSGIPAYSQKDDLYVYNTVYSREPNVSYLITDPFDFTEEERFDCIVKASRNKTNGELSESWSKFGSYEYIEVESSNGPINAIVNYNDVLLFFQNTAFGVLSVNDRSLITDNISSGLVLGTGGVLDRYDYKSKVVGCSDKFSITYSKNSLYWYDRNMNSVFRFTDSIINLSRIKQIQSYIDSYRFDTENNFQVRSYFDLKNDEFLITFYKENETNGFTLSYNENMDAFISFYSFIPVLYVYLNGRYLTTTNRYYCKDYFDRNRLFIHDSNISKRCQFYSLNPDDTSTYYNSTIKVLFNPEFEYTKVFDNIFFIANTRSDTADIFNNVFSSARFYNDFQNTDYIELVPGDNIVRRERGWWLSIPRNAVNVDVSSNPNIFTDLDKTQLFKERMRDKYLIADFIYENNGTYKKFTISNIGLKYRISYR